MKLSILVLLVLALLLPLVSSRVPLVRVRRAADPAPSPAVEEADNKDVEVLDDKKEILKTNEAFYYYYGYPGFPYAYGYGYPYYYYPYATYPVVYV